MNDQHSPARATAEEKFAKRQRQAEEAVVAIADHEKAEKHRIDNTRRLRALRLARDAELAKAGPIEHAKGSQKKRGLKL